MSELAGAGHHGLIGGGASSRYKQLLQDLAAEDEEFKQEAALRKVTEMLLMGTEETLGGFRPDQFVPALHHLLECEHRPQVALLACEALCNMLEAIPSCSDAVAQHCAPALCAKLLNIEYIDLAERALTTIGMWQLFFLALDPDVSLHSRIWLWFAEKDLVLLTLILQCLL